MLGRPGGDPTPGEVVERMQDWVEHGRCHVRRPEGEGTRPKLPWGIGADPAPARALPLFDAPHGDGMRLVIRSVVNHLNDLGKARPWVVMDRLQGWARGGRQAPDGMAWITAHGLCALVKAGDARALAMLGFRHEAAVDLAAFALGAARAPVGAELWFAVELVAAGGFPVLGDQVIWYQRGNGGRCLKRFEIDLRPKLISKRPRHQQVPRISRPS